MPRPEDVVSGTRMISVSGFPDWLRQRIEDRQPTAVVRFGDAEARMLLADRREESMQEAIRKLESETGLSLSRADVLEIRSLVRLAFDSAEVLGIRYPGQFVDEHKRWFRELTYLYNQRVGEGRPPAALAHCLLNHHNRKRLREILAGRRVSAITCRDVRPALEAEWGLEDVAVYQVPSQHLVRDVDGPYEAAMHDTPIWPDAHRRVRLELKVREAGEIFLVGAGLFGKDLCIRVRDKGGIAIDMGSAMDRIAGKITRGPKRRLLMLYSRGLSVDEITSQLQRRYGTEVDRATVLAAMAELREELGSKMPPAGGRSEP